MFRRMLMIGGWVLLLICLGILFLVFKKQLINLKNRLEEKRVRGEGQHRLVEMKSADMVIS